MAFLLNFTLYCKKELYSAPSDPDWREKSRPADKEKPPSFEGGFSLMEKIEEKRYNSLGLSPKLALFYQFRVLFVNVDVA